MAGSKLMILKQKSILILISGAAAGLTLGGVTAYWWLSSQRPLPPELPVGSDLIPQDALMTVSFVTDEQQWQRLEQFGTPASQEMWKEQLTEWRDRLLDGENLNYQTDVKPWIGQEITVAILPAAKATASDETVQRPLDEDQRSVVILLPIDKLDQAQAVLARLGDRDPSAESRNYKGLPIDELPGQTDQPQFATVLNQQTVVVSKDEQAVEWVIDTFKGEASVADTAGYRRAFEQISVPQPFVRLYVNAPQAKELASANSIQSVPLRGVTPLQHNQGIAMTVTLNASGFHIRGTNWLPTNSQQRYPVGNQARQMPDRLPANTVLMFSGGSLAQFWQTYSQTSTSQPDELANPNVLQQAIRSTTGLDAEKDLIPWMDGEFAMAAIASAEPSTDFEKPGAGLVVMVETSDRSAAEAALKKLDQVMQSRYGFRISEDTVKDQPVTRWDSRFGSVHVTRGWLDRDVVFLAFGSAIAETFMPEPDTSLADHSLYQETTASSLSSNNGHFFIDLDRLLHQDSNLPIPNLPGKADEFFGAIRAIGVTAAIQGERSTRYDINVLLRKLERPSNGSSSPQDILPPESFPTPSASTPPATP
jgi:hypothetical protein